jgi:hypothetical protein
VKKSEKNSFELFELEMADLKFLVKSTPWSFRGKKWKKNSSFY